MSDAFAGRSPRYPAVGAQVLVLEGDHAGQMVEVTRITGHAFHPVLRAGY